MIFSCEKDVLSNAVNTVIRAAATKSNMPVLEGILISTDGDCLILTANNLEYGIEYRLPATVTQEGSAVLDAKMFSEIVRKLPNATVSVEVDEGLLAVIKCQKSLYNIKGQNPVDFPDLPPIKESNEFKIPSDVLKSMVRATYHAVSVKSDKPVLTGSLFEVSEGKLCVVALDGFRMAIRRESVANAPEGLKIIVPGKTLAEITRMFGEEEKDIEIKVSDKYVSFSYEGVRLISRLIGGEYFDYKKIIPGDCKYKIKMNLSDLETSVSRADPIVSLDVFKNPVRMTVRDDTVTIDCMTAAGRVSDVIEIEESGAAIEMGFNQKYLHDALSACEKEKIILELNGELNPCIIKPEEGDEFLYMVLPVRLKKE